MAVKINWDAVGISASLLCAVHCAVLPLVVTSLPFFGINIIHNNYFEWGMISFAFVVGTNALFHGYRIHHKNYRPMVLFAAGFVFLTVKEFLPSFEVFLLIPAVGLIVGAHYFNYRLFQKRNHKTRVTPAC